MNLDRFSRPLHTTTVLMEITTGKCFCGRKGVHKAEGEWWCQSCYEEGVSCGDIQESDD